MSFWLDWWLLITSGVIIVGITKLLPKLGVELNEYNNKWVKRLLMIMFISIFFLLSVGLLAGFTQGAQGGTPIGPSWLGWMNDQFFGTIQWFFKPYYDAHPDATSTEFMFSSAQPWLRDLLNIQFDNLAELADQPFHLFGGVCLFALYPWWLFVGVWLGDILFGSKPGKSGIYRIGWAVVMLLLLILVPLISYFSLQASILAENLGVVIIIMELGVAGVILGDYVLVLRKK